MKIQGRRYDTLQAVTVEVADGNIASIEPTADEASGLPWLAPAFVDLQFNGWGGISFTDLGLTPERVAQVVRNLDAQGVSKFCPTVITHSFETIRHGLRTIAAACDESPDVARRVCGIHVEGPYMSKEEGPLGAHPPEHMRAPDWDEFQKFQEAAQGRIVILTLSPEYDSAVPFIQKAVASGVIISIGHTSANSEQIKAAVDAGASMSTHLGNGSHGIIRRHPNYIWDQLAEDRLVAGLITDGHHLPPSVIKSFIRGKTVDRVFLVSDVSSLAGLPPGVYDDGLRSAEILEDGPIVVAGQRQYLAGAALPIGVCVANAVRYGEVSLQTACDWASRRPVEILGQTPVTLDVGSVASLVQFDLPGGDGQSELGRLTIRRTVVEGDVVFDAA